MYMYICILEEEWDIKHQQDRSICVYMDTLQGVKEEIWQKDRRRTRERGLNEALSPLHF